MSCCGWPGAVEDASEHPVAAAIAAGARERLCAPLPAVRDFASTQGSAFPASWAGMPWWWAGRPGWNRNGR